jgi:uncharacterized Zn finger protein
MHITLPCPSCGEKCEHILVDESRNPVVRCTVCGHTHRGVPPKEKEIQVRVILSQEGESRVCSVSLEPGEFVALGDFLAAECGDEASGVEVTSIESKGKRVKRARARDVSTLWTRAIDQVVVRASVHKGWVTSPVSVVCEGDEEFSVGESWTFGPLPFRITHMKLRDGRVLRRDGHRAPARSVKRIYGNRL